MIGSWSFPGWYEKFIADVPAHPDLFGPVDREEAVRDAVRLAIDDQLRAGLDRITDGEMQRVDFNLGFYDYLGGLEPLRRVRRLGAPAHDQREPLPLRRPRSRPPTASGRSTEYHRLREFDRRPRARCPSPGRSRWPAASQGGEVYADRHAVTEALIPIVNAELKAARRRRASTSSSSTSRASPATPTTPDQFLDVDRPHGRGGRCLHQHAHVLRQLPRPGRGLAIVPPAVPAHRPGEGEPARPGVRQPRDGRDRAPRASCPRRWTWRSAWWTSRTPGSSPPELVAERLRTVLKYVDAERVSVTPDCGFSQTARHIAVAKAKAMAEGGRIVRRSGRSAA